MKIENNLSSLCISRIFIDCLLRPNEFEDGQPNCNYIIVNGVNKVVFFHCERFKNNIKRIKALLEQLKEPNINYGTEDLFYTIDDIKWTNLPQDVEYLMELAIALNIINNSQLKNNYEAKTL